MHGSCEIISHWALNMARCSFVSVYINGNLSKATPWGTGNRWSDYTGWAYTLGDLHFTTKNSHYA